MRRLLVALLLLCALPAMAQTVALTVTKSGSDVVLTFSGGTGPYQVLRSGSPTMTTRTAVVSGSTSPATDTGGVTRGNRIEYYQVSDSTAPTVTISTPANGFEASAPCLCSTGAASSDVVYVYVNTHTAIGTTAWAACADTTGVPLAVQSDPRAGGSLLVIASAVDADGNWAFDATDGTYTGVITARVPCKARVQGE